MTETLARPLAACSDFRALGVSDAVCAVLDEQGITHPVPRPERRDPRGAPRRRRPRQEPDRLRQDARLRDPDRRAARPGRDGIQALVLVPTRELASQVTEAIQRSAAPRGIRTVAVYGGVPLREQAEGRARARTCSSRRPAGSRTWSTAKLITIDARLGARPRRGRPDARHGLQAAGRPDRPRCCRRSARRCSSPRRSTARSASWRGATRTSRRASRPTCRRSGARARSTTSSSRSPPRTRCRRSIDLLPGDEGLALVFVRTKAGADRLVEKLRRHDIDAIAIHGDKAQAQRERALARFDAGKVRTLVATDVAARGLDVEDITHVINFDPPEEAVRLHAPRRPHRPRRPRRHRDHARAARAAGRGQPRRAARRARPSGSRRPA